jgi:hypothetical protein
MVICPTMGPETKTDSALEGQQQYTRPDRVDIIFKINFNNMLSHTHARFSRIIFWLRKNNFVQKIYNFKWASVHV